MKCEVSSVVVIRLTEGHNAWLFSVYLTVESVLFFVHVLLKAK